MRLTPFSSSQNLAHPNDASSIYRNDKCVRWVNGRDQRQCGLDFNPARGVSAESGDSQAHRGALRLGEYHRPNSANGLPGNQACRSALQAYDDGQQYRANGANNGRSAARSNTMTPRNGERRPYYVWHTEKIRQFSYRNAAQSLRNTPTKLKIRRFSTAC